MLAEFRRLIPNYDAIDYDESVHDEKPRPKCKQTCLGCFTVLLFCTIMWSLIFVYFVWSHDEITKKTKICSFCFLGLVLITLVANMFHKPYNVVCVREYLTKRVRGRMLSKILAIGDGWFFQKETFKCDLCHRSAEESVVCFDYYFELISLCIIACMSWMLYLRNKKLHILMWKYNKTM